MSEERKSIHTISFLVANKPGVLSRVALVFARRGYNIDALSVSPSFNQKYSRMTVTAQGADGTLDQIIKQAEKLIDVIHVTEHSDKESVQRELALLKVKFNGTNKPIIQKLIKKFNAEIIEDNEKILIISLMGTTEIVDEFETNLKRYGVLEMVRSGKLVMVKGENET